MSTGLNIFPFYLLKEPLKFETDPKMFDGPTNFQIFNLLRFHWNFLQIQKTTKFLINSALRSFRSSIVAKIAGLGDNSTFLQLVQIWDDVFKNDNYQIEKKKIKRKIKKEIRKQIRKQIRKFFLKNWKKNV